jgi:signal transduction histidine kinase
MLYRMVQELIQNILKHAHAHHVLLQLIEDGGKIRMFVEDDGVGFDVDQTEGGYGLQNLHYRVRALQGELSITSEPSRGTTVYIEFDLNILLKRNSI